MTAPIDFYFACPSPWSYLALDALGELASRFGREIAYKPIEVERAWEETGTGRPLGEKPQALQDYRHVDLPRWAEFRGVEIEPSPKKLDPQTKFLTSKMIIAARQSGGDPYVLTRAFMQGLWIGNKDISDAPTVREIADSAGFDGGALLATSDSRAVLDEWSANTTEARGHGVWSVPSIVVNGELFYGQDRLELIAWRLQNTD